MIQEMDKAFWNWADKMRGGLRGPLGYARANWYRVSDTPTNTPAVPFEQELREADQVEALVKEWHQSPNKRVLSEVVRTYYTMGYNKVQAAKHLGLSRPTLDKRINMAHEELKNYLRS